MWFPTILMSIWLPVGAVAPTIQEPSAPVPLHASPIPGTQQAAEPADTAEPEESWVKKARPPWSAYVSGDSRSSHHLLHNTGTALYRWNDAMWLVNLHYDKAASEYDRNFYHYYEREFENYRWAIQRYPDRYGTYPIWFLPAHERGGAWCQYTRAKRIISVNEAHVVPQNQR